MSDWIRTGGGVLRQGEVSVTQRSRMMSACGQTPYGEA